jgi:hypothetical protein
MSKAMKNKRENIVFSQKPQSHSVLLLITLTTSVPIIVFLGMLYQIPLRFTVPVIILLIWFGSALALRLISKRHS